MAPSNLHEDLTKIFDDIVDAAGSTLAGASKGLRSPRLRGRGEPPGTGMEPDCAFYVGKRARGYLAALTEGGEAAAEAFIERTAPDLVVEVEITSADAGKAERYGEMEVRELWRLHGRKGTRELRAEFLALGPGSAPRNLAASEVLPGLTPGRRMRCGGRGAAQSNPRRADGGGGPDRAPPATRQRAGARGASAVSRASLPAESGVTPG